MKAEVVAIKRAAAVGLIRPRSGVGRRLVHAPCGLQALHRPGRKIFAVKSQEVMIPPGAVDVEVAPQKPFIPEAIAVQHLAGGRVIGQVGCRHPVQTHSAEGMVNA